MDKNTFGNYIKQKRLENGYTQKQLAELLFIDVTAVSKWERGVTYPDISLIPEICLHLNISEQELIRSSNDTESRKMMSQAKQYIKIKNGIFYSFSAAYFIAVLTCFIVNLAVSHSLSWFFIVLTSCVCGFTFVPSCTRFFKKFKLTAYILTTFVSMFFVFLSSSVYTKNYWVWTATTSVLLGYFCIFAPFLFSRQKAYMHEKEYLSAKRFFLLGYSAVMFLLTLLLLFCISKYTVMNLQLAIKITSYCYIVLLLYGVTEIFALSRAIKLGIDGFLTGGYLYGLNGVLNKLLENTTDVYRINFCNWGDYSDGNVALVALLSFCIFGIVCLIIGIKKCDNQYYNSL